MSSSDEAAVQLADEIAAEAASFVAAIEAVAGGVKPSSTFSLLILALSGILAAGARLGAQEDIAAPSAAADELPSAGLDGGRQTSSLRTALAEQFGGLDEYREALDPYVSEELITATLSGDLATIAGDLLQGLASYTQGSYADALAWWQHSYLSNWGPSASSCLRAVQSLIALIRLGTPMGSPAEDLVG